MTLYPTKEQILETELYFEPSLLEAFKLWKAKYMRSYSSLTDKEKHWAIYRLLHMLCSAGPDRPFCIVMGPVYAYNPASKTIIFGDKPSIVSALHELGHHMFGSEELKACQWSVQLFRTVCPKDYAKLEWDGHMLKKRQ